MKELMATQEEMHNLLMNAFPEYEIYKEAHWKKICLKSEKKYLSAISYSRIDSSSAWHFKFYAVGYGDFEISIGSDPGFISAFKSKYEHIMALQETYRLALKEIKIFGTKEIRDWKLSGL